jgi:hypothetical protein
MEQRTMSTSTTLSPTLANSKGKEKKFFIAGLIIPIISVILDLLNLPFAGIFKPLVGVSIFAAIIALFIKKYKNIGKKFLMGALIAVAVSAIIGLLFTILFVATKE